MKSAVSGSWRRDGFINDDRDTTVLGAPDDLIAAIRVGVWCNRISFAEVFRDNQPPTVRGRRFQGLFRITNPKMEPGPRTMTVSE